MTIKQNPNRLDVYIGVSDKEPRIRKKKCASCQKIKFITSFYKDKSYSSGLSSYCKKCYLKRSNDVYECNKKRNEKKSDEQIFHGKNVRCSGVNVITKIKSHYLPATKENFHRDNRRKSGIRHMCIRCYKTYSIEKKYGISFKYYEKMYDKQEGKCQICNIYIRNLYVDHDHETNEVRGLLCNTCNRNLGHLENRVFVIKAIRYLKKYNVDLKYLENSFK